MKLFWIKCFIVTIATIALTWFTSRIADLSFFRVLFPETIAIQEFEFTDFAFDLTLPETLNDKITIVNIGEHDRGVIGDLVSTLNNHKPAVIGIDAFFNCPVAYDTVNCPQLRDRDGNENLRSALGEVKALVLNALPLRSKRLSADSATIGYDSLELSDSIFSHQARNGHAFMSIAASSESEVPSCRNFDPRVTMLGGQHINAFAVEVAMLYDSVKATAFLKKFGDNDNVPINFKGNVVKYGYEDQQEFFPEPRHFLALEADDILMNNFPSELVTGRIVLMEYLGETLTDRAREREKFYTPLNRKKIGRTFPDMYQSVIDANIVNMIITGDYLYELTEMQEWMLTIFICFFHVAVLLALRRRFPYLHDLAAVGLVIAIIAFMALFRLVLFTEFNVKSDLGFTIGSLALAGIVVALYHDFLDARLLKYLHARVKKDASEHEVAEVEK